MVSQYTPLTFFLADCGKDVVELTFGELERLLGRNLPDSAKSYRAWWANSGHHQASAWASVGYRVQRPDLSNGVIRFVRTLGPTQPNATKNNERVQLDHANGSRFVAWRNPRSKWEIEHHLNSLDEGFERYLQTCGERRIFSGPSTYFYARTIEQTRNASTPAALARDKRFHELIYATLTSWGMHRMGESVTAKLAEFNTFSETLQKLLMGVGDLAGQSITDLSDCDAVSVVKKLAPLVDLGGITASGAPLVANTKTLHFILPDLVPPMDRTYTGRFFFGPNKGLLMPGPARKNFEYMFSALHGLARRHAKLLRSATGTSYLCLGHAKGLDNAVIGYVLTHPRYFPKSGRKGVKPVE